MKKSLRIALLLLLGACAKAANGDHDDGTANRGAVVVRVGKVELREADVQRAMTRDPGASSARFQAPEARRELIDGLVRFELLAQAAERAGWTKDPDAIHALRQIAVTKLLNQTLGGVGAPETITKEDIERDYAEHVASDYTLPPAAQVSHIFVTGEKQATRLAAQAKALAAEDERGFSQLVSTFSEDVASRARGGDLGFIDKSSRLSPALVEAALTLRAPGEIAGPIHTDSGYEILRLKTLRAAAVSPLSSVEEPIRQRLYRERRAKALDDFIARLRSETPVEIVEPKSR